MEEQTQKKKILLIEDDVFMIELLVQEFGKAGFEIAVEKTGKEGIDAFQSAKPDLILLDLILPDLNGLEVLREIRNLPEGSGVKVIVLSNVAENHDIEDAKRLGALDYLIKANFSLSDIIEKVRSVLST